MNWPFDDQSQSRIRLETEAISLILVRLYQREWDWVSSEVLLYEVRQNPDVERMERVLLLALRAHQTVETNKGILDRAGELGKLGFDSYDAIHLASAELAQVDVFLTTDDQILKVMARHEKLLPFLVENPVKWLEEVLK